MMIAHASMKIGFIDPGTDDRVAALAAFLNTMAHVQVERFPILPRNLRDYDAVVTALPALDADDADRLSGFVRAGHGWLMLIPLEQKALHGDFGFELAAADPVAELRLLFYRPDHFLASRLPDAIYLPGFHRKLTPVDARTEAVLYADWRYEHSPMLVRRPLGEGCLAATTLQAHDHPILQKIVYRILRQMIEMTVSTSPADEIGVGLLGYAPSVGQLHGLGANATAGLKLEAVCDLDPRRRARAEIDFPGISLHTSAEQLAGNDAVHLVIVATPPNSHAELAMQMLGADKHVACEKPLALNRRETDAMQALAQERRRLLCCHQNRRFDADYLAIKKAVDQGRIGDVFHLETFVGGFHHPCGYWHSHAPVSGGTSYDWGAHYLDWIVGLLGSQVKSVQGIRHNRVWQDVTNADQERIMIRFDNGCEAEFIHSDIAAARKPKWYLLGTRGAIVGHWQDVTSNVPDDVHYYQAHDIPATEMPPRLTLHLRENDGAVVQQEMALPPRTPFAFHQNLADHIHWGEPLAAPLADSVLVVAILEAAARSMSRGSTQEVLHG